MHLFFGQQIIKDLRRKILGLESFRFDDILMNRLQHQNTKISSIWAYKRAGLNKEWEIQMKKWKEWVFIA